MTDALTDLITDLIRELRQRAKVTAIVGDATQTSILTRAADALESLSESSDRVATATESIAVPPTFTATRRAHELFHTAGNLVPVNATKYRNFMCRKYAGCSEVILTAFAHYAQIEEHLPCDAIDDQVTDEIRAEYAKAVA